MDIVFSGVMEDDFQTIVQDSAWRIAQGTLLLTLIRQPMNALKLALNSITPMSRTAPACWSAQANFIGRFQHHHALKNATTMRTLMLTMSQDFVWEDARQIVGLTRR